jgi:UDP-N-acetylmuramate dehydrogenase
MTSQVRHDEAMGPHTTYRIGGSVASFVTVEEVEDLVATSNLTGDVRAVGNGSNLLVADGRHDIVAVQCVGALADIRWSDSPEGVTVVAGAGMDLPRAARRLATDGVVGFAWAVGVPGTFGGGVAMNAGGHGSDMAASVSSVVVWREGSLVTLTAPELGFGYRTSALAPRDVVIEVTLRLERGDAAAESERLREIVRWRREHQPGGANAGSVFRNPPGDAAGRLIEAVGGRGLRVGSASVSTKHANFIIAESDGVAHDVFALMREVRRRVRDEFGITLEPETKFWGFEEAL